MRVAIVFYSMYGHMYKMAQAAAEGAISTGADVKLLRIAETLSPEVLAKTHAADSQMSFNAVPVARADDLEWARGKDRLGYEFGRDATWGRRGNDTSHANYAARAWNARYGTSLQNVSGSF